MLPIKCAYMSFLCSVLQEHTQAHTDTDTDTQTPHPHLVWNQFISSHVFLREEAIKSGIGSISAVLLG